MKDFETHEIIIDEALVTIYLDKESSNYYLHCNNSIVFHKIINKVLPLHQGYADLTFAEFLLRLYPNETTSYPAAD